MIAKYCQSGVAFVKLGDIVNIFDNLRRPIAKEKRIAGSYPYYGANRAQDWVSDYIFDGVYLLVGEYWQKLDNVLLRFIYYYLQTYDISHLARGHSA